MYPRVARRLLPSAMAPCRSCAAAGCAESRETVDRKTCEGDLVDEYSDRSMGSSHSPRYVAQSSPRRSFIIRMAMSTASGWYSYSVDGLRTRCRECRVEDLLVHLYASKGRKVALRRKAMIVPYEEPGRKVSRRLASGRPQSATASHATATGDGREAGKPYGIVHTYSPALSINSRGI
jgi:hypothetical protein